MNHDNEIATGNENNCRDFFRKKLIPVSDKNAVQQ